MFLLFLLLLLLFYIKQKEYKLIQFNVFNFITKCNLYFLKRIQFLLLPQKEINFTGF